MLFCKVTSLKARHEFAGNSRTILLGSNYGLRNLGICRGLLRSQSISDLVCCRGLSPGRSMSESAINRQLTRTAFVVTNVPVGNESTDPASAAPLWETVSGL